MDAMQQLERTLFHFITTLVQLLLREEIVYHDQ